METLAEFLKSDKNQTFVLGRIVGLFRESGEWGKRGLYAKIGSTMGLSPAYVGRVLTGKQSITDTFLEKLATYFGVSVPWLRGAPIGPLERFLEGLKLAGIDSKAYNQRLSSERGEEADYWRELVAGQIMENCGTIPAAVCNLFGINSNWVQTGCSPRGPALGVFPPDAPIAPSPAALWGLTQGLDSEESSGRKDNPIKEWSDRFRNASRNESGYFDKFHYLGTDLDGFDMAGIGARCVELVLHHDNAGTTIVAELFDYLQKQMSHAEDEEAEDIATSCDTSK